MPFMPIYAFLFPFYWFNISQEVVPMWIWKWGWHHSSPFLYWQHSATYFGCAKRKHMLHSCCGARKASFKEFYSHRLPSLCTTSERHGRKFSCMYIYIYGPPWTTQDPDGKLQFEKVDTFLKFNMEPENEPHHRSETEIWLGNHV